jgi:hypothetical protein
MQDKRYLRDTEVAALGIRALATLRNDRCQGRGIPFFRVGRSVRYRAEDVDAFVAQHMVDPGRDGERG